MLAAPAVAAGLLGQLCGVPAGDSGDGSLTLDWTLQFGSAEADTSYGIAALGWGDAVVAVVTEGALGGSHQGGRDVYVARLDRRGDLVWETQLGGPAGDSPLGISAGPDDSVYVAGFSEGDLAGPNAGSADVWLARLDPDGAVLWQRQFGGELWDRGFDVAAFDGGAYVSGYTFGQVGDEPAPGGGDAFVARFDGEGNREWVVQFGTERTDWGQGSALAPDGGLYVTGFTEGDLGGPNSGGRDAFVARLAPDGTISWVRQFGSSGTDWTQGVAADGEGNVYVVGLTDGQVGDAEPAGGNDWLLAGFSPDGDRHFVVQEGTAAADSLFEVRVRRGELVATGSSSGTHESAGIPNRGNRDGVLVRFDATGEILEVAGLGTAESDDLTGLAVAYDGRILFSGHTSGGLAGANRGRSDVLVGVAR